MIQYNMRCIWKPMMPHCLLAKVRCIRVKGWVYKGYGRHAMY